MWQQTVIAVILILGVIMGGIWIGFLVAKRQRDPPPSPKPTPPPSELEQQYGETISTTHGTGITAAPNNTTAESYTAPTAWAQIGIIKTKDESDDTYYPLYERRISDNYAIFEYAFVMVDRNNWVVPLPGNNFLEDGTELGVLKGMESKGSWIVDRYRNINWVYTV